MKRGFLAFSSFRFYWRSHLGLMLGAFLTSAILCGSLVVGDSVRASLRKAAGQRLGKVQTGILGGDRWFTQSLASHAGGVPVIISQGSVSASSGQARANAVQVLGVNDAFWKLGPEADHPELAPLPQWADGDVLVNEALASRLGVKAGDSILIRVELPSAISRDAPLSGDTNQEATLRRKIAAVLKPEQFGNFQLTAAQTATENVFVPLADLQTALEKPDRVNVILGEQFREGYAQQATLEDYALKLARVQGPGKQWEISTDRVFLDEALAQPLLREIPGAFGVLTYLINGVSSPKSEARTPYSMVTATDLPQSAGKVTITQWLAEDLSLAVGDPFTIRYFKVGIGREMVEESAEFTVGQVLPMTDPLVNRTWTPNFPGVSDVDNCRDWQPGIPVKLDAIRDKDEQYWDDYHGTPKVFIPLAEGQKLWQNRFGALTSLRLPDQGQEETDLRQLILGHLSLESLGLNPQPLQTQAQAAARGSVDFGGLFIGLSLFLIAAALVFAALLFLFTLERRVSQIGLLLAVGWTRQQVQRSILTEAGLVAVCGSLLGLLGGAAYARAALAGLNSIWSGATAGMPLHYFASVGTITIALAASLGCALLTLWWASRRMFRRQPKNLLAGEAWAPMAVSVRAPDGQGSARKGSSVGSLWLPAGLFVLALSLAIGGARASQPQVMAGLFFGAGFLLLASGLLMIRRRLRQMAAPVTGLGATSTRGIGFRNVARLAGRSLAVIGMMAGGIFLVIAVNAFRLDSGKDPFQRDSGTGGFALIGETSLPVYEDLNAAAGWEAFALDEKLMAQVKVVPFRVRDGDDASCLNLNRAQNPQLTAVNPLLLVERQAFRFASGSWNLLMQPLGSKDTAAIPGIADQATAMWGLGKGVGDTITYTDDSGRSFAVQLVALLSGSVLQGKVIVSEADYLTRFPNTAGYKSLLVDVSPPDRVGEVQRHLTRQLESRGLALQSTTTRLNAFLAVQNTYIGIFTILGGLGVLLGTAGLGVLTLRNVLERKAEFGLLQALGFRGRVLRRMVLSEHGALLAAGLVLGLFSAAVAVWPNLAQSGGALPLTFLGLLSMGILLFGLAVCWLAARLALRGKLIEALRQE